MNEIETGQTTVNETEEVLCLRGESAEAIAKVRSALAQIRELLDPDAAASDAVLLEDEERYETELADFSEARGNGASSALL